MESLYLLIPLVLLVVIGAIRVLIWAINSGQYDDLDKEGQRILFDEPEELEKASSSLKSSGQDREAAADDASNSKSLSAAKAESQSKAEITTKTETTTKTKAEQKPSDHSQS